jgi:hypothetical protein
MDVTVSVDTTWKLCAWTDTFSIDTTSEAIRTVGVCSTLATTTGYQCISDVPSGTGTDWAIRSSVVVTRDATGVGTAWIWVTQFSCGPD